MGLLEQILRVTPFHGYYKRYKKKNAEVYQQKIDAQLLPQRINFYKNFIKGGDLVFDVGANIGNRVEAFLKCEARIVAVEPQSVCVEILKQKFKNQITIENVGLSDSVGELEMQIATDTTVSTFNTDYINKTKDRFKYSKWDRTIKVSVTTIDNLIAKYGIPKFCKIDVEGFELQVLKGLHTAIPYISFEYCVPEMQEQATSCLQYLHQLNPKAIYNYCIGETMELGLANWLSFQEFMAHLQADSFIKTSFGDIYINNTSV